jgi:hypothetical protein
VFGFTITKIDSVKVTLMLNNFWIHSNKWDVVKLLFKPINVWYHNAAIIHNIKKLLAREWRVKVVYTLWEGNVCANYLAKLEALILL